jgi:hypothetical protein
MDQSTLLQAAQQIPIAQLRYKSSESPTDFSTLCYLSHRSAITLGGFGGAGLDQVFG